MNLPKTSEMQQVLAHFIKAQIPISKEQLMQAEMWMKALPEGVTKMDALQALQKMVELKMPMTQDVFQALVSGQKTSGMSAIMDNFTQLLAKDTALQPNVKQNLMQQVLAIAKPFEAETGTLLLAKSIQLLTNNAASTSERLQALTLLKEAGILPQQATLQNWSSLNEAKAVQQGQLQQAGQVIQTILATKPENKQQLIEQLKSWTASQNLLSNEQKQQLNQMIDRFNQLPTNKQTLEIFAKQMQEQLIKAFAHNAPERLFTQDGNALSVKEHLLSLFKQESTIPVQNDALMRNLVKQSTEAPQPTIQRMLTEADAHVRNSMDSKAMEHALKILISRILCFSTRSRRKRHNFR
ncbi:Glycosyltransferase OS=Lysinibacillus sphaericus OX=1421 GN=LS41612_17910 PE=4 SV=1 [Lysinibacillus sphaericus]